LLYAARSVSNLGTAVRLYFDAPWLKSRPAGFDRRRLGGRRDATCVASDHGSRDLGLDFE
jgi:hypothetical protein